MKKHLIDLAEQEALRFLSRIAALRHEQDPRQPHVDMDPFYDGGEHTASVKRASMELTRALSKMRANQ
ncbi:MULTISPECIES: hypothetical protein [Paracoccus]|uniref:hypothetical protein n=1 Tax=Paracoccus TaxID=265 RepID=UPI00086A40F6|nr:MULTISPECIES: hypothetical protein [Paracoccus]ODT60988.1 MAG: hypothetical protein ABS73_03885 [Paracoccus sp. SCN 68-21]